MLQGTLITLQPYSPERCHEFWKGYVSDPDMWEGSFTYNKESIDRYFEAKVLDPTRRYFAVCNGERTVGEIQLKHIDFEKRCGTMSIHFANNDYKNRGWGTEAERFLIQYAFDELGLETIYADCVHRNKRSQHVLEKNGFVYSHEDDILRYYILCKNQR